MDTLNIDRKCWGCGDHMPKGDDAAYCPACRKVINSDDATSETSAIRSNDNNKLSTDPGANKT